MSENKMSAKGPNGEQYEISYSQQLQERIADNLENLMWMVSILAIIFVVMLIIATMLYMKLDAMNVLSIIGG